MLQIKDDAKHGFYVENLTEEYVTSYEDITQVLIKVSSNKAFKLHSSCLLYSGTGFCLLHSSWIFFLCLQGLSSRKLGATSINAKSSRSHIVFSCVIDSWCKVEHDIGVY